MEEKTHHKHFRLNYRAIMKSKEVSGYEKAVLHVINDKTLGFNKHSDRIPISQFVTYTGFSRDTVMRTVTKLEAKNIIKISRSKGSENRYNLNYSLFSSRSQRRVPVAHSDTHHERNDNNHAYAHVENLHERIEHFAVIMIGLNVDIRNKGAYKRTIITRLENGDEDTKKNFDKYLDLSKKFGIEKEIEISIGLIEFMRDKS